MSILDARFDAADLTAALDPAGPRLGEVLRAAAVDGVRLVPVPGDVPVGGTRYGGVPDLPDALPWPRWTTPAGEDRPLSFFAQVDVATLADLSSVRLGLPVAGSLMFFCDLSFDGVEGIFGYDAADRGGMRVVHVPEPARRTAPPPAGVVTDVPHALLPVLVTTVPDTQALQVHGFDVTREVITQWYAAQERLDAALTQRISPLLPSGARFLPRARHQLGGHSVAVQGSPEAECATAAGDPEDRDWRLLLQLDSCPDLGTDWAGGGSLFWCAADPSLQRRAYDEAWFVLQC